MQHKAVADVVGSGSPRGDKELALLVEHHRIYLDATGGTTDALLVRDGRIAATGDRARNLCEEGERRVTPEGECLFPALADAHCHLWGVGLRAGSIDLSGASHPDEIYERLRSIDAPISLTGWVLGHGWDEHDWATGEGLSRGALDRLYPDRPVCLHRVDRHAVVANSEAIRRAGIDEDFEPPGAGRASRGVDGRLDGLFIDEAMLPVVEAIPEATEREDRHLFERSAETFLRHGITSVHMALVEVDRLSMLREMAERAELPLRTYAIVDGADDDLSGVLQEGPHHDADGWLSVRAVKLFADGALGSKGAHLIEPYDDGSHGLVMLEPERMRQRVVDLAEAGWQPAVHAIGDAGARNVLDAFGAVSPARREELRPRLEHAQMLTEGDCRRLGECSAVASIQPIHLRSDGAWADRLLSDEQLDRLYPWPSLADHAPLAGGSDFPIEDPNPWHGIATALSRETKTGASFSPHKALTREQILSAYTTGAAHAAHWEAVLGRLDQGYVADFIALERDPYEATIEQLWGMNVAGVWMAGEEVI